jgi:hypothetical protein
MSRVDKKDWAFPYKNFKRKFSQKEQGTQEAPQQNRMTVPLILL